MRKCLVVCQNSKSTVDKLNDHLADGWVIITSTALQGFTENTTGLSHSASTLGEIHYILGKNDE